MADGDIKPLGFAIDTSALEKGAKAAEAFVQHAKGMGGAAADANKNLGDMGKAAGDSAKGVEDATKAAEKLAAANKAVAESADAAKKAQTELANAPKPVPAPNPGQPVQGANGGNYADQGMADWANAMGARRAQQQTEEAAKLKAAKDRMAEAAEPIKKVEEAAQGADEAVGALSSRMGLGAIAGAAMGAALGAGVVTALFQAGRASIEMADSTLLLERRLSAVTGEADKARIAIDGMKASAAASGSSRSGQIGLQSELLDNGGLNLGQGEIQRFGSTLGQIDAISGNRAADFDKFGNSVSSAMKDGRVQLGELNAMLDQSPALADALADAFDMPIEKVKQLAAEGGLFAEDFARGLNRVDGATKATFDGLVETSERGFNKAKESATSFWESFQNDEAVAGFSSSIADAITEGFSRAERELQSGDFWPRLLARLGLMGTGVGSIAVGAFNAMVDVTDAASAASAANVMDKPVAVGQTVGGSVGPQALAQALGAEIRAAIPNATLGSGYRSPERQAELVQELPGIASPTSRHPTGGAYDFQVPGMGEKDLPRVRQMLQSGGVKFEDVLYHNNHFHVERGPGGATQAAARQQDPAAASLLNEGGATRIAQINNDLKVLQAEKARNPNDPSVDQRIAEKQAELRNAQSAQNALGRTPVSQARDNLDDRTRAAAFGGGGAAIASQAYASARAAREQGYEASDDDFLQIGISGAVLGANTQVQRTARAADAAEAGVASAGRGRMAAEQDKRAQQVSDFRFQNFGSLEGEGIDKAVNDYASALERLSKAQRDTANAQELLNATTQAGVSDAEAAALAGGKRGYAVDLARQEAEEEAIRRDGGSVDASRTRFDARNRSKSASAAARARDGADADGRYMEIGSDAFSRREYGRGEQLQQAGQQDQGATRQAELRAQFTREDARLAKDRADADLQGLHTAERQLEVAGKVGAERRAAQAILERENELIAQGLLPAGAKLSDEEAASVVANAERLRLIQQQVEEMDRFASVASDTSSAVGGGLRSLAGDFFADAKVESDKLISAVQGVVSRIGTSIADGLIIKPIERATERVSEMAVDWISDAIGAIGGKGGSKGGEKASAGASVGKEAASAAGKIASDVKASAAATAKSAADLKGVIATQAASSALALLTKSAMTAAAAMAAAGKASMAGSVAKSIPTPAAFGQVFPFAFGGGIGSGMGGVGASPTLFPMAGGMGLAFEAGAEAVLPLKRGPDGRLGVGSDSGGGGGGTSITVIDQRGANAPAVETQENQGPDGKRMISLMIRGEQKSAIKEGAMDGAMRDTYGIPRQVARR